jgi:hypothetical protein
MLPRDDLEYLAEFERHQFDLYEARRLAEETHASAVMAAALIVAGLVLTNYARKPHPKLFPDVVFLGVALLFLAWAFAVR